MTVTFITTDTVDAPGFDRTVQANDLLVIRQTGSLESVDDVAITMVGTSTLRVEGVIFTQVGFGVLGLAGSAPGMRIDITATGSIMTGSGLAIRLDVEGTVTNAGHLSSNTGGTLLLTGSAHLFNSGLITGGDFAVGMEANGQDGSITNAGVIRSGLSVAGGNDQNAALSISNASVQVTNTGLIETLGSQPGSPAIRVSTNFGPSDRLVIDNAGTIRSQSGVGIDAAFSTISGVYLVNSGLVTAGQQAFVGSTVADEVVNTGTFARTAANSTALSFGNGSDTFRNAGDVQGRIDMGADGDFYIGGGATSAVYVLGGSGNDVLTGSAAADSLYGGADNDLVRGGAGDDELIESAGLDTLFGGAGDDNMVVSGSESAQLFGGIGDDSLMGFDGNDSLFGGFGDDRMEGGGGNDTYDVTSLQDEVIEVQAGGTADTVTSNLIALDLGLYNFVENATLTGAAALSLTGSGAANRLTGNIAANRISGDNGNDTILGGGGADRIQGGQGADRMTGGAGADVFIIASAADTGLTAATRDQITDFTAGSDDLQMIFMSAFIGAAAFTAAGQVRYVASTGLLSGSTDADAAAEWTIQLQTGLALTAADFIL